MRRAWPPVYRPTPQQKVVSAAAVPQPHQQQPPPPPPLMTRLRRDTVAAAAASGACFLIAAPCSCSPSPGPLTVRNQQHSAHHHRGPPPPLPARNGGCGRPYRYCPPSRPQKCQVTMARPLLQQQQQYQQLYHQHQYQHVQQYAHPLQQRPCAYVKPRPSRSLENLLRVVELDDPAAMITGGHHGVYEKSSHYESPRRKLKVPGKENRLHAWKRRSMESLLSARDAAALATKTFEFFNNHVRLYTAVLLPPCSIIFTAVLFVVRSPRKLIIIDVVHQISLRRNEVILLRRKKLKKIFSLLIFLSLSKYFCTFLFSFQTVGRQRIIIYSYE